MPANTRENSSAMSVSLPVTAKVMREASSEWMLFHRFCSLVPFFLSIHQGMIWTNCWSLFSFFFFTGSIDYRSDDHILDRSDAFFRYRISTHIKTIAYFPLQRWLNLPAFPTNERTNELRVPMQGILKSRARFSNSQGREGIFYAEWLEIGIGSP